MKKLNETASEGSTSAGAIATTNNGLHFPLARRLPPTNVTWQPVKVEDDKSKTDKE